MIASPRRLALLITLAGASASAQTQSGGFVVTLGADTVQIERFTRSKERLDGTVVRHSPETTVMTYSLTFAADGSPKRYEYSMAKPDGTPLRGNADAGSIEYATDSVTREVLKDGQLVSERVVARPGMLPGPSLPYIGTSVLLYEIGFDAARKLANAAGEASLSQVFMIAGFRQPSGTRLWFIGKDSVEMDYFGVTRRGFRLDEAGRIVSADWTNSTYKYRMRRIPTVDVNAIAKVWGAADASGKKMGAMSPQDTVRVKVGTADVMVTYSRPSKRGRVIWGELVPWNAVWRFGADFATHISTSADLMFGSTVVPAGRYTLWMRPSEQGSELIVNKSVNIFGTNYNPANDLVRVPLNRSELRAPVEKFTLQIVDGQFMIWWDQTGWSVPVAVK